MLVREMSAVSFAEEGAKRCEKGKSCKATCIYQNDKCLSEFEPPLQKGMGQFRDFIAKTVKSGGISEDVALAALSRLDESWTLNTAKDIANAFKKLEETYLDPEEREEKIQEVFNGVMNAYSVKRDKTYKLTPEETKAQRDGIGNNRAYIERLDKIEEKVKSGKLPPEEVNALLAPFKQERQRFDMSESQVDLAWALLPSSERTYLLDRAGSPSEAARYAPGQGTMEIPKNGWGGKLKDISPEERLTRAKMGLKTYMDEDGRDMYSGVRYPITRMEWEHTIAVKNAGQGAETGANTGWTLQTTNRTKSDGSPSSVFKEKKGKVSDAETFNLLKKQASAARDSDAAILLKATVDNPGLVPKDKASIIGEFLFSAYGVPKTFVAGAMTSGRASARRTEWMKTGMGIRLMVQTAREMQRRLESGDTEGAAKLAERIKGIPNKITNLLNKERGAAIGSAGSTEYMNQVLQGYLE